MRFGVFDDLGDHPVVTAPFGLQVEHTLRRYFRGVLFGPPEIVGRFDDDFQFAGAVIGPEGDFSPGEIAFALANGFEEITLGRQRLRTETAALAAVVMASVVNG